MTEMYLEPTAEEQARRDAAASEARLAEEDLRVVVHSEPGFRVLLDWLRTLGAEGPVEANPVCADRRNMAEALLDTVARVDPHACLRLLAALRNMPLLTAPLRPCPSKGV